MSTPPALDAPAAAWQAYAAQQEATAALLYALLQECLQLPRRAAAVYVTLALRRGHLVSHADLLTALSPAPHHGEVTEEERAFVKIAVKELRQRRPDLEISPVPRAGYVLS